MELGVSWPVCGYPLPVWQGIASHSSCMGSIEDRSSCLCKGGSVHVARAYRCNSLFLQGSTPPVKAETSGLIEQKICIQLHVL